MVLISALTPQLLQTPESPNGLPMQVFDSFRTAMVKDRSAFFYDVPTGPFFGYNRPGATASKGMIDSWWAQGMQASFKSVYDTVKTWETNFREDLKALDFPVLVLHGDDDQVVPFAAGGAENLKYLKHGKLKVYKGGAHALPNTEADAVNQDLLDFINT
jgi:non-heme chloroperoxidase